MSWASHNPEKWDEICKQGICDKLYKMTFDGLIDLEPGIEDVVDVLYEVRGIGQKLVEWSTEEINKREADYWSSKGDRP